MSLTPSRQVGHKKPTVITDAQYREIERDYENLKRYSKEELIEKAYTSARIRFTFDEHIDKWSVIAHIMSQRYGDRLEAYGKAHELRKKAEKSAKRKERRAAKKHAPGKGPDCETCQSFMDCAIVEDDRKRVRCTDYYPNAHQHLGGKK